MTMDQSRGPFIMTASGKLFHFLDPDPEAVTLEDIAVALSHICRFTGHCNYFYSVAEHSVHVMRCMMHYGWGGPEHRAAQIAALFHDAAEAYVGDVAKPLKHLLADVYEPIEARAHAVITKRFDLPPVSDRIHAAIKEADLKMLATEMAALKPTIIGGLGEHMPTPWERDHVQGWHPQQAAARFFEAAERLGVR